MPIPSNLTRRWACLSSIVLAILPLTVSAQDPASSTPDASTGNGFVSHPVTDPVFEPIDDTSLADLLASHPPADSVLEADDMDTPPSWRIRRRKRLTRYAQADFLYWWAGESELPTLLVEDPAGTPLANVGTTSASRTVVGNETVGDFGHPGIRLRLGRFVPRSRISRLELDLWYLFEQSDQLSSRSLASEAILSRPFTNSQTGDADAQVINFAGVADGQFDAEYARQLAAITPSMSFCLNSSSCRWLEFSTGYRYLWLRDELNLRERVLLPPGGLIAPGSGFDVRDEFRADNHFHLWRLGLSHTENRGRWLLNLRGNLGLGLVRQRVTIDGRTRSFVGDATTDVADGGLLALRTNSGEHDRDRFAWVPDLDLTLKRQLGDHVTAHFGYTVMYLPDVVKAVDHVPTTIDPRNIPTVQPGAGPDPVFAFANDDLLVHGLHFGMRYDW